MPSMTSLFNRLKKDYPQFQFVKSTEFWWSASSNTLHLNIHDQNSQPFSLHELSHALLSHTGYLNDIDLIKMERDAWEYAVTTLADTYNVTIPEDLIQDNLDTYREWLHARSTCPDCGALGIQTKNHTYRCLSCTTVWRANEARICALRRHTVHIK